MYFNFVSKCFEKHIGNTLTVSEYLAFKRYYNRLVREVMRLDEEKCEWHNKNTHFWRRKFPTLLCLF